MPREEMTQAEQNIAVVRGFYDALGTGGDDGLSDDAMARVIDTFNML